MSFERWDLDASALVITVFYSCRECGLVKVPVTVPARGNEDVVSWMQGLGHFLSADHNRRRPDCHPQTLSDILIPMQGRDRIGGPSIS